MVVTSVVVRILCRFKGKSCFCILFYGVHVSFLLDLRFMCLGLGLESPIFGLPLCAALARHPFLIFP
jgi:hypothetical protein